jgi:hypothetical protein
MDAWRMAGHLVWWPAKSDSAFHWRENPKLTAWLQHEDPQKVKAPAKTAAR